MMNFAALQIIGSEKPQHVIQAFFEAADAAGLKFQLLKPFELMSLGSNRLLRFQTDCPKLDTLATRFKLAGRCYAYPVKGEFLYQTKTAVGRVPGTRMTSVRTFVSESYKGTSNEFWKRQFSETK